MSSPSDDAEIDKTVDLGPSDEAETTPNEPLFDGRYRIVKLLGEGGFGKVYVVEDTLHADERLALKLVKPEHQDRSDFALRFRNEIRVLRTMQHEGIPQIFNDGMTTDGEVYFTMALVPGRALSEVLKEKGVLSPLVVANYVRQIVGILEYAHGRGVVHRDLKPANVIVVDEGTDHEKLRILDFGIAKILRKEGTLEQALTMETQMPIGTPHYMAPEQVRGREVDGRTDLYALGVMIHRMVSGKYPFAGGTSMEILAARLQDDPTPLEVKNDTGSLSRLVHELLEREMDKRPSKVRIEELLVSSLEQRRETNSLLRSLIALAVAAAVIAVLLIWKPWASGEEASVGSTELAVVPSSSGLEDPELVPKAGVDRDPNREDLTGADEEPVGGSATSSGAAPEGGGSGQDLETSVAEPESPAVNLPAEPIVPSLIRFEPADGASLPFDRVVKASGVADYPLTRATVNGVEAELDGTSFTARLELESLVESEGELRIQLWGEREIPSLELVRRVVLPEARVPAGCVAETGSGFMQDSWASAVVHERSGIRLLLVEGAGEAAFYIGEHEVTWSEYESFKPIERPRSFAPEPDHPVVGVSFDDAIEFCDRNGLELPTGEDWSFAASGTDARAYPWGGDWVSGACNAAREASTDEFEFTSPADQVQRAGDAADLSWCQAIGFAGNVSEWCTEDDKPALYGGSYLDDAEGCRLQAKQGFLPQGGATHIGFRVLLRLE